MIAIEHIRRVAQHWFHDNDGGGVFAVVKRSRTGDFVRKVTLDDPAYLDYAEWVQEQHECEPWHKFLPVIHSVRRQSDAAIIRMEPLHESGTRYMGIDSCSISDLFYKCGECCSFDEALAICGIDYEDLPEWLDEDLWEAAMHVIAVGQDYGWSNDLHSGNIMLRPDGTPVITDPWYASRDGLRWHVHSESEESGSYYLSASSSGITVRTSDEYVGADLEDLLKDTRLTVNWQAKHDNFC